MRSDGSNTWPKSSNKLSTTTPPLGVHTTNRVEDNCESWAFASSGYQVASRHDDGSVVVLIKPPADPNALVFSRGEEIIIKPGGFLLWQTKEVVGTPEQGANLICFIDGKSTRARTGLLVHLTAPTIHASWSGKVTLEISNLGPFDFVLTEGDAIAQIVVATVSSVPSELMKVGSVTYRQLQVTAENKS